MKKIKLLIVALLAMLGSSAYAGTYVVDQRFTSVADLDGQLFSIVNETDGKACYNVNNQNLAYDTFDAAVTGVSYQWVLESLAESGNAAIKDCYLVKLVKADGSDISLWGNSKIYLNSGASGGFNGCFILGLNGRYGQDDTNCAVWEIEYVEGKGFALKNKALGGYFAGVNPAPTGTDPIYWTFCTLKEDALEGAKADFNAVITEAKSYAGQKMSNEAEATLAEVIGLEGTAYATSEEYIAATEAANTKLDAVKASVAIHKQFTDAKAWLADNAEAKMSTAAKTAYNNILTVSPTDESDAAYTEAYNAISADYNTVKTSVTSYKVIASGLIPDNSLTGWVCENTNTFHINTWSTEGNSDGSNMKTPFIENWVAKGSYLGAGKVYYKLEGLEPGEAYMVSALVRSYNEANSDAPNGPNFFINDTYVDMTVEGTTFTFEGKSGIYATLSGVAAVGTDGTLTLGVEINSDRNYNWIAFKSVKIQNFSDALATKVAEANAFAATLDEGTIKTKFIEFVEANDNHDNSFTTAEQYANAIAALDKAMETYNTAVKTYGNIEELVNQVGTASDGVKDAFFDDETVAKAYAAYKAGDVETLLTITTEDVAKMVAALKTAVAENYTEGDDITVIAPTSWFGATGTVSDKYMKEAAYVGIAERYQDGAFTGDVMTQSITGLQNGTYRVVLHGGASYTSDRGFEGATGQDHAYFFANDALQSLEVYDRTEIADGAVEEAVLVCAVTDGTLKYGIQNITIGANWFVVDLESITYQSASLPATDVDLVIGESGYATFIAPFQYDVPAGVKAYTVDAVDENGYDLVLTELTTVPANTPVVLTADAAVTTTVSGVSEAAGLNYTVGLLTGVYGNVEITEGYVLQKQGEKVAFYVVSEENPKTVPANHAYLTVPAGVDAKALGFDAITTAINTIATENAAQSGAIYNVNGQLLNTLQRGINIVGGKKVLVK